MKHGSDRTTVDTGGNNMEQAPAAVNPEDQFLSVDDFGGSVEALLARLCRDQQACDAMVAAAVAAAAAEEEELAAAAAAGAGAGGTAPATTDKKQATGLPAWLLSILDETSTRANTVQDEMERLLMLQRFRILDEESRDPTLDRMVGSKYWTGLD